MMSIIFIHVYIYNICGSGYKYNLFGCSILFNIYEWINIIYLYCYSIKTKN